MTVQVADTLTVDGVTYRLDAFPLEPYFERHPERRRALEPPDSSVWRGYVAAWAIDGGTLYLVDLTGWVAEGSRLVEVGLEAVFPGDSRPGGGRIPASWFSGELRLMGRAERIFSVKDGRVVAGS